MRAARLALSSSLGSRPTEAADEEAHDGPKGDRDGPEGNVAEQEAEEQA